MKTLAFLVLLLPPNLIFAQENSITSHQLTDNRLSMSEAEKRVLRAKIEYDEAVKEFEKIKTATEAQISSLRTEGNIPKECILSPKGLGVYSWILIKNSKPESCTVINTTSPPNERGK
jgi:hypothetical protein